MWIEFLSCQASLLEVVGEVGNRFAWNYGVCAWGLLEVDGLLFECQKTIRFWRLSGWQGRSRFSNRNRVVKPSGWARPWAEEALDEIEIMRYGEGRHPSVDVF